MAHKDTLSLMSNLGIKDILAQSAQSREIFRISLERNHRAMRQYAKRQYRLYKRKRISADEYEAIRASYNEGLKVYQAGLRVYRENRWFDPKAPKDRKLWNDTE